MKFLRACCLGATALLLWLALPVPAEAQEVHGLAYDSMFTSRYTKSPVSLDSFQPDASFDRAVTAAKLPLGAQVNREFFLGSKYRRDALTRHISTIVDCSTGTETILYHDKKTYSIKPLFRSPAPSPSVILDPPPDQADQYEATYHSRSLGARTISGMMTQGYSAEVRIVKTRDGTSTRTESPFKVYLSAFPSQTLGCAPQLGGSASRFWSSLRQRVEKLGKMPGSSAEVAGPVIPDRRLAVFFVMQVHSEAPGALALIAEIAHVRELTEADASVFSIPPGYQPGPPSYKPENPAPQSQSQSQRDARIVQRAPLRMPDGAVANGWTGTTLAAVSVDTKGRVVDVTVHKSSGHKELDEACLAQVRASTFAPEVRNGSAVAGTFLFPCEFSGQ